MTVAALARGVRLGRLDRAIVPAIDGDGRPCSCACRATRRCATCGVNRRGRDQGDMYLTRPAISGADDRGGALVLLAALEVHELWATR